MANTGSALYGGASTADFARWCEDQAAALRARLWDKIDVDELADELESLGRSERRALESALCVVLLHLLKERYQPGHRSLSWDYSIREHSRRVVRLLSDSPSLKVRLDEMLVEAFESASLQAAVETGLAPETFGAAPDTELLSRVNAELSDAERRAKLRHK